MHLYYTDKDLKQCNQNEMETTAIIIISLKSWFRNYSIEQKDLRIRYCFINRQYIIEFHTVIVS